MKEIVMAIVIIVIVLYTGWFLADIQQHQIGVLLTRRCNETTLKTGCYTNDTSNNMIYCKNKFNQTLNINVSTCERVTVI